VSVASGAVLADRFHLVGSPVGQGESGVVWRAWDEVGQRDVAVKILHAHLSEDADALGILRAEAGAAGRLQHPCILEVFGLWSDGGRRFLVSAYFDGIAVSAVSAPMAPPAVVALGRQVSDALCAAHRAGVIHGDVRPGNVLLGTDGARLFDFGIASWLSGLEATEGFCRPGVTAPEVQAGGQPGVPADLYGLGVVLYRALHGAMPWERATPFAAMAEQSRSLPNQSGAPVGLVSLIQQLLDPDPTRRPADAEAVRAALQKLGRDPQRAIRVHRRWIAPIRPRKAWIVHGVDPGTGGPAVVQAGLGRRAARRLRDRLRGEGWEVEASKEALDWIDLSWAILLGICFGLAIPAVGFFIGGALGLRWRSAGLRTRIRGALPELSVAVPARRLPAGSEYAVSAGLLMLVIGALLWWWPVLALFPTGLLGVVVWMSLTHSGADPHLRAERGRVATVLAEIAAMIEGHQHALEDALQLQGELLELERRFASEEMGCEEVLIRARMLRERAGAAERVEDGGLAETLDRLRHL